MSCLQLSIATSPSEVAVMYVPLWPTEEGYHVGGTICSVSPLSWKRDWWDASVLSSWASAFSSGRDPGVPG